MFLKKPVVSIIIPIYNVEKYISRCIKSILQQCYEDFEVIIIDDGSTDNSAKIIFSLKAEDNRIKYFYQENRGPSAARNKGICEACGEFILFIDSDDVIKNNYISRLVYRMREGFDLVCCGYEEISLYGVSVQNDFCAKSNISCKEELLLSICRGVGGVLWSKIFRADIIKKNNMKLKESIFMCEDLIFNVQYCKYVNNFYVIEESLYQYNRLNSESISARLSVKYLENILVVNSLLKQELENSSIKKSIIEDLCFRRLSSQIVGMIENECKNVFKDGFKNTQKKIDIIRCNPEVNKWLYDSNLELRKNYIIKYLKSEQIALLIIKCFLANRMRHIKQYIKNRIEE